MKKREILYLYIAFAMALGVACTPSTPVNESASQASSPTAAPSSPPAETTESSTPTSAPTITEIIPVTGHLMKPADVAPAPGQLVYDVPSSGTAAPYGDSYKINRFERPFQKDMTYVSDLDIVSFNLSQDADWYYLSIELKGKDPNNSLGIHYGVEIDLDADGFGDYLIWASPPYATLWDTSTVQVFKDSNHDSGGSSSKQSDVGFQGNGYETLIFDGEAIQNADHDLAWVRMTGEQHATIQFAFKNSWISTSFLTSVTSDAGLKDVSKFDYSDRFPEVEAGSPLRDNNNYPLGLLYAVDNTCWQAYGAQIVAAEPKFCPSVALLVPTRKPHSQDPLILAPTTSVIVTVDPNPVGGPADLVPPACEPPTDCEFGYNPNSCQCNPPPADPVDPVEPDPPACEPPTDCEYGYDPSDCQCNPPPADPVDPVEPDPPACEPPTDCEFGYNPNDCQCNGPPAE